MCDHPFLRLGGLLLVFVFCGCSAKPELGKAQAAVETALNSWKNGEDSKQLASKGIEIAEPDWSAGFRLVDYTVKNTTAQPQQGPRVVVVLNMKDRSGKKVDTEVAYEVLVKDKIQIGRDAFHAP